MENGGDAFSLATDIPIRLLNPDVNGNNGGIGDIQLVQKTRLMDGSRWQMTQILRTIFNSGNARKGLGTGHVSMEPGLFCRYKWSELTYMHSEACSAFPSAAIRCTPARVTWGIGLSHVWYETDTVAFIPTLEFVTSGFLTASSPAGRRPPVDVPGDDIFNLGPGFRMVRDTGGDLGVVEFRRQHLDRLRRLVRRAGPARFAICVLTGQISCRPQIRNNRQSLPKARDLTWPITLATRRHTCASKGKPPCA